MNPITVTASAEHSIKPPSLSRHLRSGATSHQTNLVAGTQFPRRFCAAIIASVANLNLGNLLRFGNRDVEAEAAFSAATRVDPNFADAWYNLSDLFDQQGRVEAAIECLRMTVKILPDYVDAMFNIALLPQRTNQYAGAADFWPRYIAIDRHSEWAARARRSL
jgi:tetratricopeptide (TPR) repeat protein